MRQAGFSAVAMVLGVVVVVALIAGGVYLTRRPDSGTTGTPIVGDSANENTGFTGTLTDLLKNGQTVTCTFERTTEPNPVSGTVYVSGERMRGDFKTTQPNGTAMNAHVIRDTQYMYFWSDEAPQGTKIAVTLGATPSPATGTASPQVVDESFDYNCQPWTAVSSQFTPPVDKQFLDLAQAIPSIPATLTQPSTGTGTSAQCATCNQLEAAARTQCLQALGCN